MTQHSLKPLYAGRITNMTGPEFEALMNESGYTRTTLAAHWGMARQTIGHYCKAELVETVYAEAIQAISLERRVKYLEGMLQLANMDALEKKLNELENLVKTIRDTQGSRR